MPDDPNLFDNDNLLPDWLTGDSDSDADWLQDRLGSAPPAQTPPPASGARPPWETYQDSTPPTAQRPAAAPPWQQHAAPTGPESLTPSAPPPWQAKPGPVLQPPAGGRPPASFAAPAPAPREPAGLDEFNWAALGDERHPPAPTGESEIPLGLTGMLPWRNADQGEESAPPPASYEEPAWMESFGQAAAQETGAALPFDENDLDWLMDESPADSAPSENVPEEPVAPPEPPAEAPPAGLIRRLVRPIATETPPETAEPAQPLPVEDLFALDDDLFADSDSGAPPVQEPEPASEPFEEEPPAAVRGDLPDWLMGEAAPPSGGLSGTWEESAPVDEESAYEEEAESGDDRPAWIDDGAGFATERAPSNLSYDEWEQAEIEREREAAKTEEDRLLEQVPEWFAGDDQPAAPVASEPPPQETGPEFVPEWFTGLEAPDLDAAPDWFQKIDYTTNPLAAPPDETPPPEDESAAAVPDWFKADGLMDSALPGADWAATFGAPVPPPVEQPPVEQQVVEQPSAEQPVAERPVETWELDELPLPDESDFLDRLGSDLPFAAEEQGADAWMQAFEPQEAPTPTPGSAPRAEPPEDFVERFEPFEPGAPQPVDFGMSDEDVSSDLDWLQEISADDLVEQPPEPPQQVQEVPPAPAEPETFEDQILAEAMTSSQSIDSLLGISDSGLALTIPEPQVPVPADVQAFEWTEDDPWLDLDQAEPGESGLDAFAADDLGQAATEPDALAEDLFGGEGAPSAPAEPEQEPAAPHEGQRPEWLEEMRPADLPVTLVAGGTQIDMVQKSLDDLPDSLRILRDRLSYAEETSLQAAEELPAPNSGPLAGIAGVLPIIAEALPPIQREAAVEGLMIAPDEQKRIERLQAVLDLLAAEEEDAEEDKDEGIAFGAPSPFDFGGEEETEDTATAELEIKPRPRRPTIYRIDRLIIMLIMLAALIAPFVTDAVHFAADPPALGSKQQAVANTVEALEPDEKVLVALEYGPTAAGELDALAEAVLRDILVQRADPILISTNPVMALHAEAVLAPLVNDTTMLKARGSGETTLNAGEDYTLLAYLPGDAVGVRSLTETEEDTVTHPAFDTDLRGDETFLAVHDVETDVALIVVVGEDSTAIRTWAEQLETLTVPKVALVTASVEALAEPYVNADGYAGYLAGVRDTYSYNAARNSASREPYTVPDGLTFDVPAPTTSRWHSMALGAAVAAGVIALGTVVNMVRALGRRRRR